MMMMTGRYQKLILYAIIYSVEFCLSTTLTFQHVEVAGVDDDDFGDFEEAGDDDDFGQFETSTVEVQEPVKDDEDNFSELFDDSEKVNYFNIEFACV